MYLDFYHLKSAPFASAPDPAFFFGSARHKAALDTLAAGSATHHGWVVITGAPGLGKTTVVHTYLARVAPPRPTVVLWQAPRSFRELLTLLAHRFEIPVRSDAMGATLTQLQQCFRHEAQHGGPMMLLIDEAQDMPLETLAQLPLLAPLSSAPVPLLQIVLVGQPALQRHLRRWRQRRVAQRIGLRVRLTPLTEAESLAYIRQRMAKVALPGGPLFTPDALQALARHARGVPRDLNRLCTMALQAGCGAQQQPLTADLVQQVLTASRGGPRGLWGRLGFPAAAGLVLGAGLVGGALFSAGPQGSRSSPAGRAHSWMEAPRPTSAPLLVAPRPPQPAPQAESTPGNAVGHDPDEDHIRLGPRESLESQRLETPFATPTSPTPAVPPPVAPLTPRAIPPTSVSPRGMAFKSCDELKTEIQAKLDAKRVTGYVLTIIVSGDVQGHHIVGSCEGSTKKIALHRSRNAP